MKLSKIKRDTNSAENGVWITNAMGDIDLLIASMSNKRYTEMLRAAVKPYKRTLSTLSDDFIKELQNKCIAKTVLLGWRNMEAEDSTEEEPKYIDYTIEAAREILEDPENHEFRELVVTLAEEEEVFRKEDVEAATFPAG